MSSLTKPVVYWAWAIAGLIAFGATAMAADLSALGVKVAGVSVGLISNDATKIGEWVQEGRSLSEDRSDEAVVEDSIEGAEADKKAAEKADAAG